MPHTPPSAPHPGPPRTRSAPTQVDGALLAHPAVAEAVSFAAPDEKYGEVVAAAVVLTEEGSKHADGVGERPRPPRLCYLLTRTWHSVGAALLQARLGGMLGPANPCDSLSPSGSPPVARRQPWAQPASWTAAVCALQKRTSRPLLASGCLPSRRAGPRPDRAGNALVHPNGAAARLWPWLAGCGATDAHANACLALAGLQAYVWPIPSLTSVVAAGAHPRVCD